MSRILKCLRFYPTHLDFVDAETWCFWVRDKVLLTTIAVCRIFTFFFPISLLRLYSQRLMQTSPSDTFPYNGLSYRTETLVLGIFKTGKQSAWHLHQSERLPLCFSRKESTCQFGDAGLIPGSIREQTCISSKIPWIKKWQTTPVFLFGKSHGQRSLAGYSPWGHKDLDTT